MQFSVKHNMPELFRQMDDAAKQTRFAMAKALTATAKDVREAQIAAMRNVFDRPTKYTLNSLYLQAATRQKLEARVWFKDDTAGSGTPATEYLLPQVEGGKRRMKSMERMLQRIGALPVGWQAVPGSGAQLDAYGNMSRGQINQILSYLQAFGEQGYSANATAAGIARLSKGTKRKRGIEYFVSRGKTSDRSAHLHAGVWARVGFGQLGKALKPLLMFVPRVNYRPRFRFFDVAQRVIDQRLAGHFTAELQQAMRSARVGGGAGQA